MLHVKVVRAVNLIAADSNGCSDPYCVLQVGSGETYKTKKCKATLAPVWEESFDIKIPPSAHYLRLEIWDADIASRDDSLGRVMVPLAFLSKNVRQEWFGVQRSSSALTVSGEICLQLYVDDPLFSEEIHDELRIIASTFPSVGQLDVKYDNNVIQLPGKAEEIEMVVPRIVFAVGTQHAVGTMFLTNYRIIFVSDLGMQKINASRVAEGAPIRQAAQEMQEMDLNRRVELQKRQKQLSKPGALPITLESSSEDSDSSEEGSTKKPRTPHKTRGSGKPGPSSGKFTPPPIPPKNSPSTASSASAGASAAFGPPPAKPLRKNESKLPKPEEDKSAALSAPAPGLSRPRSVVVSDSKSAVLSVSDAKTTKAPSVSRGLTPPPVDEEEEEALSGAPPPISDDDDGDEAEPPPDQDGFSRIQENAKVQGNGSISIPLGLMFHVERLDGTPILRIPCELIVVHCHDFREVKIFLQNKTPVFDVWKRLRHHVKAGSMSQTLHFVRKQLKVLGQPQGATAERDLEGWGTYDVKKEFERQQVSNKWKLSELNVDFALCDSYPDLLYFPAAATEAVISGSAEFRSRRRLPTLSWYNARHGNCIARCAQPNTGLGGAVSEKDEQLVAAIRETTPRHSMMWIVDCRSKLAASGNRVRGHGTEQIRNGRYQKCRKLHMDIANIHVMRKSLDLVKDMARDKTQAVGERGYFKDLDSTGWTYHCSALLAAAAKIAYYMEVKKISVLVHCSDGWDRTSQLTSLAELLCDPYYRTFEGFRVLVEKEWLSFGHKFHDRFGNAPDKPKERSPVFVQFLDCVYQVLCQFPLYFEFTADYLVTLATHCNSGWFGTFLFNTLRERRHHMIARTTMSIWNVLTHAKAALYNRAYQPSDRVLIPLSSVKEMCLWQGLYLRYDDVYFHIERDTFEEKNRVNSPTDELVPMPKEGSLWKLGHRRKNWKLRFFVLSNRCLRYYTDETKKHEQGSLETHEASLFTWASDVMIEGRTGFMVGVKPRGASRIFVLQCSDKHEKLLWVQSLEDHGAIDKGQAEDLDVSALEAAPSKRTLASYKEPNQLVMWTPDEWSDQCHECTSKFTVVRRRHHCRNCGRVFCSKCRTQKIIVPKLKVKKAMKVCNACYDQLEQDQLDEHGH